MVDIISNDTTSQQREKKRRFQKVLEKKENPKIKGKEQTYFMCEKVINEYINVMGRTREIYEPREQSIDL